MTNVVLRDIENVAKKVEAGFVAVFHAIEHEVPAILSMLVNVYGPSVISNAIASHKAGVELYAASEVGVAEADTKAFVQSNLVDRFHLPPTAAQFIASGIHHLFTIGGDKIVSLIDSGAARLEAQADPAGLTTTSAPAPVVPTSAPEAIPASPGAATGITDQQKASGFTGVSGS